jgi:tetratricopeptide (TPR) repeat protein
MRHAWALAFGAVIGAVPALAPSHAAGQESLLGGLRTAAKAAPLDPNAALALGRALRRAGHETEALQELRRAAALSNSRAGSFPVSLEWELARTAIARRDFNAAMTACRSLGALPGAASEGHACAAEAHLLWRRASEALLETTQALANGQRSYEAKVAEGLAMELEVKDTEAEASLREAISWKPDAFEAHVWLGRLLVRTLRHDAGVEELRKAVQLDPNGAEPAYELARTMPDNQEAASLLEKAVRERPGYTLAWVRLADVELALQRLPEARKAADLALKLAPQETGVHVTAGRVSLAEGKPDDAIKEGQAALAILGNSAHAKLLIADAYAKKGEIDLAVENYQAAFGFDHGDPTPLVRASEACHAQGRDTSARAFGERATKEFPQWGPGWAALGDALAGQKEKALAKGAYETALKAAGPMDAVAVRAKLAALR